MPLARVKSAGFLVPSEAAVRSTVCVPEDPEPENVAVKTTVAPPEITWDCGWLATVVVVVVPPPVGAALTVSVAGLLVTDPEGFEITTVYKPAISGCTSAISNWALVASVMLSPLNCHWYDSGKVPEAVAQNAATPPALTARELG